ncbi:MAG: hypothetical protein ACXV8X_08285 [Candidatus Angelobacter sp.]
MPRPAFLKQFGELTAEDFIQHPVWIGVHGTDEDEPWFDDCDEETFRPWTGDLPVGPEEGMLLVQATFTFADGTTAPGFITPQHDHEPLSLGIIQPQVFSSAGRHDFWHGMFQPPPELRAAFYRVFDKRDGQIFPIAFAPSSGLASGQVAGKIEGFYVTEKGKVRCYR